MKTIIRCLGLALTAAVSLNVGAQSVPPLINYQGQLLAPNGNPIPTGDYDVEISLYPVESGGAVIWGPQTYNGQSGPGLRPKVSVVDGRFNLVLGPEDTEGRDLLEIVAANPSLFLEINVGTGNPIAPRQQLLTAPYALSAGNAGTLDGFDWQTLFANGDPALGRMGLGVAPSTAEGILEIKLDVNGRARFRQGSAGSAGMWLSQNNGGDRAFVGMLDDNRVGFYSPFVGWALTMDVNSGNTGVSSLSLGGSAPLTLGPARLSGDFFFFGPGITLKSFYVSDVDNSYFEGDIWANAFKLNSDERLKENIAPIEDPLEKLQAIRGVSFNFKETAARGHLNPQERRAGVLAQDVQRVLPEAVSTAPDGYLAVNYDGLIPVLIEAVKQQQRQIEALESEVTALKAGRF